VSLAAVGFGASFGSATTSALLPRCPPVSEMRPAAEPACESAPAAEHFAREVLAPLVSEAGPLLVRVEFDDDARIDSVCAVESRLPGSWQARSRTGRKVASLDAPPPGPACLSGTRLDLNEYGEHRVEVQKIVRTCRNHVRTLRVTRSAEEPNMDWEFDNCMTGEQVARSEIWIFGSPTANPSVFSRGPKAVDRRVAGRECFGPAGYRSEAEAIDESWELVVQCMEANGWKRLY